MKEWLWDDKKVIDIVRKPIKLDESLTIYPGGGCNSVVLTSNDGKSSLIVDTKWFWSARRLREQVTASDITIINTHFHLDHARGNKLYPSAHVVSGETNWRQWDIDTGHSKRPDTILKPGGVFSLTIDDETIHAISMGRAHSINDAVVYFVKRGLLAVGDLVFINMHPVLLDTNANVTSWRGILNRVQKSFEIEKVVPGHGSISTKGSIQSMKEYFSLIADAINNPDELSKLRERYRSYKSFPIISGFHRTVQVMKREMTLNRL